MTTIKAYTDIEQSKKLGEILPIESADMWWAERYTGQVMENGQYIVEKNPVYYPSLTKPSNDNYSQDTVKDIPCWSLVALLNVLPNGIIMNKDSQNGKYHFSSTYMGTYVSADNPIDACYECVLKLKDICLNVF